MPLNLRVRRTIDPAIASTGEVPWQLRYIGQPEIGNNRPTIVRSCYDIACSENAVEFLAELGCRLEFEYIAKGKFSLIESRYSNLSHHLQVLLISIITVHH